VSEISDQPANHIDSDPVASSGPIAPPPPPEPSPDHRVYRQSLWRVYGVGGIRLLYRRWTRVAARLFPEGSRRASIAERIGIPLPDRLDLSWIDPTLAVGGRVRPGDIHKLQRVGITAVVDVRAEHRDDEASLQQHQISLLYLPTPDTYPLSLDDLRAGASWINRQRKAGGRVLVHCEHGVGRSVLLAAAALVCEGYSAHDAFSLIEDKRWQASPNRRQILRLTDFERAGGCKELSE
jgi:protein tyrosine phosphatase (PTP) superfamily phosphohydrolase (DUF442 family)